MAILALLGGCSLYFGGDDHDRPPPRPRPPQEPTIPDPPPPTGPCDGKTPQEVRDPETTLCQWACNGTSYEGYDYWGLCETPCNGLDETECRNTTNCSAAYIQDFDANGRPTGTPTFFACYGTSQAVTVHEDDCYYLGGAYGCSQYDRCSMYYMAEPYGFEFAFCAPEGAPPPPPACATLTTEQACLARPDCETIYEGTNCTCNAQQCWCANKSFTHCQSG